MATLTVGAVPARTGINLVDTAVACDASLTDKFLNDTGNSFFYFKNGSGGSITLTLAFASTVTVDGVVPVNKTYAVAAAKDLILGPFPSVYVDSNSFVTVSYSAVTSCKCYAFKVA